MALQFVAAFHDPLGGSDVTDTPAGHRIGLADTVDDDGALLHALELGYRLVLADIVDVFVYLVGQYEQVIMAEDHIGQCLQFFFVIDAARRIAGRAEDDHAGLGGDGGLELGGGHLEILVEAGLYDDGLTTSEFHHLGVTDPIGSGDNHLLAGVDQRHDGVADALLGSIRHQDL